MAVQPAAGNDGEAVEVGDVVGGEKGGQDVPRKPSDCVHGENIQRVIGFHVVLELGGVIATDGSHHAKDGRRPRGHVAGSRGDGHKPGDAAGAEADGGPFVIETVVEKDPCEATGAGGEVRDHASHDGAHVRPERGSTVKAKPADPEKDGSDDDVGDVVWPIR